MTGSRCYNNVICTMEEGVWTPASSKRVFQGAFFCNYRTIDTRMTSFQAPVDLSAVPDEPATPTTTRARETDQSFSPSGRTAAAADGLATADRRRPRVDRDVGPPSTAPRAAFLRWIPVTDEEARARMDRWIGGDGMPGIRNKKVSDYTFAEHVDEAGQIWYTVIGEDGMCFDSHDRLPEWAASGRFLRA